MKISEHCEKLASSLLLPFYNDPEMDYLFDYISNYSNRHSLFQFFWILNEDHEKNPWKIMIMTPIPLAVRHRSPRQKPLKLARRIRTVDGFTKATIRKSSPMASCRSFPTNDPWQKRGSLKNTTTPTMNTMTATRVPTIRSCLTAQPTAMVTENTRATERSVRLALIWPNVRWKTI